MGRSFIALTSQAMRRTLVPSLPRGLPPVETLAPREPIDESQDHRICGPIDQLGGVVQLIRCPDDHLSGISIRFGTYRRPQEIPLVVELFAVDERHFGSAAWPEITTEALAVCTIEPGELIDSEHHHVYFQNFTKSKGSLFALRVR